MITGLGPKNLSGGGLFDAGPRQLIEDFQLAAGVLPRLEGGPAQSGDAGGGIVRLDDLEQTPGESGADALGLSDGGEVVVDLQRGQLRVGAGHQRPRSGAAAG